MKKAAFTLVMASTLSLAPAVAPATTSPAAESFAITKAPAAADWRFFLHAPEIDRERLWTYHARQGKSLRDWAWGWRLGWIRACAFSSKVYCASILTQGLSDKALVVRAEAALWVGRRYSGSANPQVVQALAQAYGNTANLRHGQPLFVQNRILFALHEVGGAEATATGARLAASHPGALAFWQRLVKSQPTP